MAEPTAPDTVELYVRSLAPGPAGSRQEATIERLERLVDRRAVEEYAVHVWGARVALSTTAARTDAGRFVLDRLAAFRRWAAGADASLEPFFETRETHSSITGEVYATVELPVLALAEYRDGRLTGVSPHAGDDGVETVRDRLDALAGDGPGVAAGGTPSLAGQ